MEQDGQAAASQPMSPGARFRQTGLDSMRSGRFAVDCLATNSACWSCLVLFAICVSVHGHLKS